MASKNDPSNGDGGGNVSPGSQLGLVITNEEVDDALNFALDFDEMAETMGDALPNINLDEMGSLGTRSPSPSLSLAASGSTSGSVMSKGSKRSRADFDSESDCNSDRQDPTKRMVFQTGLPMSRTGSGLNIDPQQQQYQEGNAASKDSSPSKAIRRDREREGRCPECGLDTHRIIMNDKGFELQPLSIKGEVLNGRCLLCNPLKEGETTDNNYADIKQPASKKGGRDNYNGEPFSSKNKGRRNNSFDNKDPEISFTPSDPIDPPSQGDNDQSDSNQINVSSPTHQQQRQNMVRMVKYSPSQADKQHLPLPISGRDPSSRRSSSGSNNNKFSTSAPNQYHSKMALTMQSKLRRKHSPRQHAMLAFGNTNNQRKRDNKNKNSGRQQNQNLSRRSSTGSGIVNQQMIMMGNSNKSGPAGSSGQKERQQSSSNASLSSVSCSEIESTTQHLPNNSKHNNDNVDDNYSKGSHFSQHNMMGGLGTAMAMGMGMHCAETVSLVDQQQQQQHRSRSSDPPSHPLTPHKNNRRTPTPSRRTPQSVPANMSNHLSNRMSQTPQTVLPIVSNTMSNRMGGGSSSNQQLQSTQSNITHSNDSMSMTGNVPPAVRLAHSKLPSSIYHHHLYPMNDDMEHAYIEKALAYLENGSGDISDIIVAMRRFPFSLAIQRVSAEKLYAHCFDTEHAHAIGLVGGIRTIIDAMEHHPEDIALQRVCAGIIKHLASASKYNVEMLDKMGAVGIVVGAMERHPNVAPLLESCCWALESMSRCHSQEFKMRVAKGGGIHAAMKAVEVFPNNESLLRAAFHCLRQLGYNPSSYNNQGGGPGGQQGAQQFPLQQQHMQKLQQFHKQQQRQHGSSSQQHMQHQQKKHQKQQVPSYVSHRGNGGNQHRHGSSSGGGMNMMSNSMSNNMPNNLMMGNNSSPMMMGNKINMNNSMMANMMNNNPMMGNNSMMGGNSNMSNMGNSMNNNNMNNNRHM
mmetsp:Transcript_10417/g.22649  ORF Transcript_10417/g.22649 Transcript_10417/m.22649 type:complete len:967 (+) Transcript_10417:201-3101(+)